MVAEGRSETMLQPVKNELTALGHHFLDNKMFHEARQVATMLNEPFTMHPLNLTPAFVNSRAFAEMELHLFKEYFSRRETLIIGDSHVASLFGDERAFSTTGTNAEVIFIGGATITGFGRRASTLDVYNRIERYIKTFKPSSVVLKFGQVDVDLGLHYKKIVKKEPTNYLQHFNEIIKAYMDSVLQLPPCCQYIFCGINIPSQLSQQSTIDYTSRIITENIQDNSNAESCRKELAKLLPSLEKRTKMSLDFNKMLKKECKCNGFAYLDYTEYFMDSTTGIIKKRYSDDMDHHYKSSLSDQKHCVNSLRETIARTGKNSLKSLLLRLLGSSNH